MSPTASSTRHLFSLLLAACLAAGAGLVACDATDESVVGGGAFEGPSGAVCPDGSTLTYDNFGAQFATDFCVACHASNLSGPDRNDAPAGLDFDSLEGIRMHADQIDIEAAAGPDFNNEAMPPGSTPKPSTAEREALGEWLACGTP